MKILTICQYYYPEPFRVNDLCEELVKLGHEVTVVTGTPNYPMGNVYPGYENGAKSDEIINGVKVHRCKCAPRKTGTVNRIINYFDFPRASVKYVKTLENDYDVVFVNQLSPVMMAKAGIYYKKKHGKKLVLYCLDIWPENLCVGGIKRNSAIYKIFKRISERIYKSADKILISSGMFADYFEEQFGISKSDVTYLPQYSEDVFTPSMCEKKQDDKIDLMFAGNIGVAQSVETIIKAADITKDVENLHWHIVGDGTELEKTKGLTKELQLNNVTFYGRQPLEDMPKFYSMADAMLVTMKKDPVVSYTLPGKVQTYMAAGKPIIGAIDGETQYVIKDADCGYCCDAESPEDLAKCAISIVKEKDKLKNLGECSRKYYDSHFARSKFFNLLEDNLYYYSK